MFGLKIKISLLAFCLLGSEAAFAQKSMPLKMPQKRTFGSSLVGMPSQNTLLVDAGDLDPIDSQPIGEELEPVRWARAIINVTAAITSSAGNGGDIGFELKNICRVEADVPVFDSRDLDPEARWLFMSSHNTCEADLEKFGKTTINLSSHIHLHRLWDEPGNFLKTFSFSTVVGDFMDPRSKHDYSGASSRNLNLDSIILSSSIMKIYEEGEPTLGKPYFSEHISAQIEFIDLVDTEMLQK